VFSHGAPGQLWLGDTLLNAGNLAEHSQGLSAIGDALSANGDLLLYGCQVADGAQGTAFVQALAESTGADIAASDDATGAAHLGGDWVLESATDSIETKALFVSSFEDTLSGLTVSDFDSTKSLTEGDPAEIVDSNVSISGATSYTEGYIRFTLDQFTTGDQLVLTNAAYPLANGAISLQGTDVYLGNGSGKDRIGAIDEVENGQDGQPLKVLFSNPVPNPGFEQVTIDDLPEQWTVSKEVYGDEEGEINFDGL
jgi:hypothetical protein